MSDLVQDDLSYEEKRIQYEHEQEVYKRKLAIYESSSKNWEILDEALTDQEKQFDKSSFAIAAGSFGVSFAFVGQVVPLEEAICRPVLAAAWAFFGFCLLIILIGYRASSIIYRSMCEEEKQNLNNLYEGKLVKYKERRIFFNCPEICNNLALISNAGGIICLILFVFLNF